MELALRFAHPVDRLAAYGRVVWLSGRGLSGRSVFSWWAARVAGRLRISYAWHPEGRGSVIVKEQKHRTVEPWDSPKKWVSSSSAI